MLYAALTSQALTFFEGVGSAALGLLHIMKPRKDCCPTQPVHVSFRPNGGVFREQPIHPRSRRLSDLFRLSLQGKVQPDAAQEARP